VEDSARGKLGGPGRKWSASAPEARETGADAPYGTSGEFLSRCTNPFHNARLCQKVNLGGNSVSDGIPACREIDTVQPAAPALLNGGVGRGRGPGRTSRVPLAPEASKPPAAGARSSDSSLRGSFWPSGGSPSDFPRCWSHMKTRRRARRATTSFIGRLGQTERFCRARSGTLSSFKVNPADPRRAP